MICHPIPRGNTIGLCGACDATVTGPLIHFSPVGDAFEMTAAPSNCTNELDLGYVEQQWLLWQNPDMIELRTFVDNFPDLAHFPLLPGTLLILNHAQKHVSIDPTKTKAFRRAFIQWAVKDFNFLDSSALRPKDFDIV